MKALIVYESMFGNTRRIAEEIARGTGSGLEVTVANVNRLDPGELQDARLLVVGAPTHAHTLSTAASRAEAARWAADPERHLRLEPDAEAHGIREWMSDLPQLEKYFAAFDTRADITRLLAGAASGKIARTLRRRGLTGIVPAESFLMADRAEVYQTELVRARDWGCPADGSSFFDYRGGSLTTIVGV